MVDGSIMKHLNAGGSYTFLGISERGVQEVYIVKQVLRSKYMARLRQIWSSCLSGKNKVAATNMLAVPTISYSFGVMKWTVDALKDLDRKTRKMMNIHRCLHPKSFVQRVYLPRHLGGRGLLSLECLHDRVILGTANRVLRTHDPLMQLECTHELWGKGAFLFQAARRAEVLLGLEDSLIIDESHVGVVQTPAELQQTTALIKKAERDMLMKGHMSKHLHSVFYKHIRDAYLSRELTFSFLRSAGLKAETEGFVFACQDGVMNTLVYQYLITKTAQSTLCRKCRSQPEMLMHVLHALR